MAPLVNLVQLAQLAQLETRESTETLVFLVLRDSPDSRVIAVLLAFPVTLGLLEITVYN